MAGTLLPSSHSLNHLTSVISLVEHSYTLCTAQRDFYGILLRLFCGKRDTRRRLIFLFVSTDGTQDQKPNSYMYIVQFLLLLLNYLLVLIGGPAFFRVFLRTNYIHTQ